MRARTAGLLVLVYALCLLAPAAALALGKAAHCLTEDHHGAANANDHGGEAPTHAHAGHDPDERASADDQKAPSAERKCCGPMCLPAVPLAVVDLAAYPRLAATVQFAPAPLAGREPERLSRPPDSSSSL